MSDTHIPLRIKDILQRNVDTMQQLLDDLQTHGALERDQVAQDTINETQTYIDSIDKVPEPLLNPEGRLKQTTIKIDGKSFRCVTCGCNVFHHPDKDRLHVYECNSCGEHFIGE